jgi:hypothetical protein
MPEIYPCCSVAYYVHPTRRETRCGGDEGPAEAVELGMASGSGNEEDSLKEET